VAFEVLEEYLTEDTQKLSDSLTALDFCTLRAIAVIGNDSKKYALIANFTENEQIHAIRHSDAVDVITDKKMDKLMLKANEAALLLRKNI
jgi:hypothetical protein